MSVRTDLGAIPEELGDALRTLQDALPADSADTPVGAAFAMVSTFCETAVRMMRTSRPGAVKRTARDAELQMRMPGGPAGVLLRKLRGVRVEVQG